MEKHAVPGDFPQRQPSASFQTVARGSLLSPVSESRLNQHLQSGGRQDQQTRECLVARRRPLYLHVSPNKSLNARTPSAADLPCLHSCRFLNLSPYCKPFLTLPLHENNIRETPQVPQLLLYGGRYVTKPPEWPRPDWPTGRPLSRLDRTCWCWQRNMRTSSLKARSLFFLNLIKGSDSQKSTKSWLTTWLSAALDFLPPTSSGNISSHHSK